MNIFDYTQQTTPPTLKIAQTRGDHLVQTVNVKSEGLNFTGTTARAQVKIARHVVDVLFDLAITLEYPAIGQLACTLRATPAQTNQQPGTYYSDLELTLPNGIVKTVAYLDIEVGQDVSN